MPKQTFAIRLQQLHADTHPGQPIRDAAKESGISYRTLGGLMNGTGSKPTFATLTKLAAYYDTTIDYLKNDAPAPVIEADNLDELLRLVEELFVRVQNLKHQAPPPQGSGKASVVK